MYNYHIHTYRCKHAAGDINDYVKAALGKGLKVIGFSDHTPFPDNYTLEIRMNINELGDYIDSIEEANYCYSGITILKGLECEYDKRYHNFFKEELLGKWNLDYIICGAHYFKVDGRDVFAYSPSFLGKKELKGYTNTVVEAIQTKLFSFIAHPDLFGFFYEKWDSEAISCSKYILEAAQEYDIMLELNTQGWHKGKIHTCQGLRYVYPLDKFWELAAQYDIEVVVNSDAHVPERITEGLVEGREKISKLGLKLGCIKTYPADQLKR